MTLKNMARTGILLALILAVALFGASLPAYAQSPQVTAEVDRNDPTLYDTVTLTVTVTGENNIGAPDFPTLSGLQITGRKITSQQTFRNGRVAAEFKFIIEMQPRHTGTIEIGPVSVPIGGDTYETDPITLSVTQGVPPAQTSPLPTQPFRPANSFLRPQGQPNQGDPSFQTDEADSAYFIESEVDNDSPYLGEQITYTSKFYSADPYFARPIHRSPDFVGFWNPDRPDRREYPETIEGNGYRVVESSEILFPTIAGNITIEPSTVGVPGGAFSSFTQYASPLVELQVRPLPSNEPPSFTGAVGQYEIEASLDSNDLVFGDSLTLTVEISGQGNFDTLPDPVWQDVPGWRAFENDSFHRTFVQDGTINGSKTFERVLIPDAPGDFDLPPIEYSYFDPEQEEYVTVSSDALSIKVAPDPDAAVVDPSTAVDGSVEVADIRHIKPAPGGIGTPSDPTHINPLLWGLGTLPIVALAVLIVWRWASARRQALLIANAPIQARREALSRLTELDPSASGADAATAALHGYLSVVLTQPSSALQVSDLKLRLQERGVSADTLLRLGALIRELDQLRFAPPEMVDVGAGSKAVADVVHRIEREVQT